MVGHGSKLGRKKEAVIGALLTQRNIEEAARAGGIGKQTLLRWLKKPEVQAAYLEARRAVFCQSNARLQQASSAAVATLCKIMVDPSAPASARVRAADRILEHGKQGLETEDIEVRLAALEQAAELPQPPGRYRGQQKAECTTVPSPHGPRPATPPPPRCEP
jgi:transposase-like protein